MQAGVRGVRALFRRLDQARVICRRRGDLLLSRNRKLGATLIAVAPAKAGAQKLPASVARTLDPRPRLREDRLFAGMTTSGFFGNTRAVTRG